MAIPGMHGLSKLASRWRDRLSSAKSYIRNIFKHLETRQAICNAPTAMPTMPTPDSPTSGSWPVNPLVEREKAQAVLDIWGDLTTQRPAGRNYGRWVFTASVAALCVWAASVSFPQALHYMAGG